MESRTKLARSLVLILAGVGVFALSCCVQPPPSPPDPYHLVSLAPVQSVGPDQVDEAINRVVQDQAGEHASLVSSATPWYDKWTELLGSGLADSVECYPITYWSRDASSKTVDDRTIQLTGMLYLPKRKWYTQGPQTVSLIAYPHGTELDRDQVPSRNAGNEWLFGAAAALLGGFAVAMPDLPGMGGADPSQYHPFCHADSLAYSVVDMVRTVREVLEIDLRDTYTWDGRLYIMGYSEGGYAALATVRELQLHATDYPGLAITGSACMAGPQDLSGAMRQLMIDPNQHFGRPFFLPYMILGYNAVYAGGPFAPSEAMQPTLLPDIVAWMNETQGGNPVDTLIEQRLGVATGQVVPLGMMNPQWVAAQLADDVYQTSAVGQILAANNLWSGWAPNRPMLIMHSPDDDCVPYANSVKTYNEFVAAGAGPYLTFEDIGKPGDGITHVVGGLIGIPSAIMWFKDVCPKN